jgi:tetratricopeptide (TPR) repeat protein
MLKPILLTLIWTAGLLISPALGSSPTPHAVQETLLRGITANFSGDYDRAASIFAEIESLDPGHPGQEFYQAVVLFWRNNVDAANPRFEARIRSLLTASTKKSSDRLAVDAEDIDALHYIGLANTYMGRLEAHNGNLYKGGMLGEKGRDFLEKAITVCEKRCPGSATAVQRADCMPCEDLYFPFGAYSYFAGRLPKFLQFLNFLWFVPRGSTAEGLDALERSARNSRLHQLGTTALLANIYGFYEREHTDRAVSLSTGLVTRFPENPYLDWQHANILIADKQYAAAVLMARAIMDKVNAKTRNYDPILLQGALLVMSEVSIRTGQWDAAEKHLTTLANTPEFSANTLSPVIDLLRGMLADALGDRDKAIHFYKKVRAYSGKSKNRTAARKAKQFIQTPFTLPDQPPVEPK